jgi:hypothetical protein
MILDANMESHRYVQKKNKTAKKEKEPKKKKK